MLRPGAPARSCRAKPIRCACRNEPDGARDTNSRAKPIRWKEASYKDHQGGRTSARAAANLLLPPAGAAVKESLRRTGENPRLVASCGFRGSDLRRGHELPSKANSATFCIADNGRATSVVPVPGNPCLAFAFARDQVITALLGGRPLRKTAVRRRGGRLRCFRRLRFAG